MPSIPFNELPESLETYNSIYIDYISFYNKVEKYFNGNFKSKESWEKVLSDLHHRNYDRSTLVKILTEQNKSLLCSVTTLANIDLLYNENCFAVVTGQQIGILTGPLYTIYKLITCIKLSETLKAEYPAYSFVPVFWAENEDHDFLEINNINALDSQNNILKLEYFTGNQKQEKYLSPTGKLNYDEFIENFKTELKNLLPQTEFTDELFNLINSILQPNVNFYDAFAKLLTNLFHQYGVILLNPNATELKSIAKNIFQDELSNNSEVTKRVIQTSAELEENYHAQIKSKPINLFLLHKGSRFSIEPQEDYFFLKNTRQTFKIDELKELANNSPELFSPNVALRPIYQDSILPTVAYIGGPAEIAYFAQLKSVYEYFQIPMPIIYPRASITLVEKKIVNISEKFNLNLLDMITNPGEVQKTIAEQNGEVDLEVLYSSLTEKIKNVTKEFQFAILQIDQTLEGPLNNLLQKFDSSISLLKEKTIQAKSNRDSVSQNQYLKFMNNIYPLSQPQERVLNIIYYLNKYGPDFISWLFNEANHQLFEHQVIVID